MMMIFVHLIKANRRVLVDDSHVQLKIIILHPLLLDDALKGPPFLQASPPLHPPLRSGAHQGRLV